MELAEGKVAVVTGAASGIGFALAKRFADAGLSVVLADVEKDALDRAAGEISAAGVETRAVMVDVSEEDSVAALAQTTLDQFGGVDVVCNNAGVAGRSDPWFGPLSGWHWVLGVNFWGVVHGVRAFLPHLLARGSGHIVNTASIAGLYPGFAPSYDASKHAVVAITEDLYNLVKMTGFPIGVSCLCPGWVRTRIVDADRNWPDRLGEHPPDAPTVAVMDKYLRRAVDEGMTPAEVADHVARAVQEDRFWVFPHDDFVDIVVERWHQIAERRNPQPPEEMPGMPPRSQIIAESLAALGLTPPSS
jgi:NAD(P)-dependent dehydrogenase (short-subunit alcohol dehydrogenase family)